jgi:hypothetical protein
VGETITGVASHDVDGLAAFVLSDEGYVIDDFEDLATPLVSIDLSCVKLVLGRLCDCPRRT